MDPLTHYMQRFVQQCIDQGATTCVISPGSRSTALAYAFEVHPKMQTLIHIDERSAGFLALGIAKAQKTPVLLLCTSGTAAANYLPAIAEASQARIPLIVITSDRPLTLQNIGAPQTMDQNQLYGNHVKYSLTLPEPRDPHQPIHYMRQQLQKMIALATTDPLGPVHLNQPIAEPFYKYHKHQLSPKPIKHEPACQELTPAMIHTLINEQKKQGCFLLGQLDHLEHFTDFWHMARRWNWPIFIDPLSNMRSFVPKEVAHLCIDRYDILLKTTHQLPAPECIIQFGAPFISKSLNQWLTATKPKTHLIIDPSPFYKDPTLTVTQHYQMQPQVMWRYKWPQQDPTSYTSLCQQLNQHIHQLEQQFFLSLNDHKPTESSYTRTLIDALPERSLLFVSNSMPIRDIDSYFSVTSKDVLIYANRGLNGIDGIISTALGTQQYTKRPLYLFIGDLAWLYDQNGLLSLTYNPPCAPVIIVLINNQGGGIFEHLPQAQDATYFNRLFKTPPNTSHTHLAQAHHITHHQVTELNELTRHLESVNNSPMVTVLECICDSEASAKMRARYAEFIKHNLSGGL